MHSEKKIRESSLSSNGETKSEAKKKKKEGRKKTSSPLHQHSKNQPLASSTRSAPSQAAGWNRKKLSCNTQRAIGQPSARQDDARVIFFFFFGESRDKTERSTTTSEAGLAIGDQGMVGQWGGGRKVGKK